MIEFHKYQAIHKADYNGDYKTNYLDASGRDVYGVKQLESDSYKTHVFAKIESSKIVLEKHIEFGEIG